MKHQVNIRVSDATRAKLDELTSAYGTQAEAMAVAIDRLFYQSQKGRKMEDDVRKLTEEEIQAFPGDASVDVAILSCGVWYYADSALEHAMPVLDVDGDYIPVVAIAPPGGLVARQKTERRTK